MKTVDLNCDMGESFGAWRIGDDAAIMDYVSSINVACGFHAGDPTVIRKTIEAGARKNLAIGAHPSFPDLQGFGRREMQLERQELFDLLLYQIAAVKGMTEAAGARLNHVKPHGALYNQAAKDRAVALVIAGAIKTIDENLILYGLSGSFLIEEAEKIGLRTASEVFADRTYQPDGALTPRSRRDALITSYKHAIAQVLEMLETNCVTATNNQKVRVRADTVCIHGDSPNALQFAQAIHTRLVAKGFLIQAPK